MKTLLKQTSVNTGDKLMSSQEGSHANHLALPDPEKERMMTVTSGQKCYEQLEKSDLLGSLVKMLLESPVWFSQAVKLQWKIKPLNQKRITRKRYWNRSLSSKPSVETLSVKDIPSSRLLFRLAPSVRPIEERGFGSSHIILPTPTASDATVGAVIGKNDQFVKTKNGTLRKINQNGQNGSIGLARLIKLLPTPQARDYRSGSNVNSTRMKRKIEKGWSIDLNDLAASGLLPTPTAFDWKGSVTAKGMIRKDGKVRNDSLRNIPAMIGETSQLSPLFVAEMMGFPVNWTISPFQSGEPNP